MEEEFKNRGVLSALALSLIGLLDSLFLSYKHLTINPLYCSNFGCDVVTTSAYSVMFGVPVAFLGVIYYGSLLILTAVYILRRRKSLLWMSRAVVSVGVLLSGWFVYVQFFILGEICPYCILSAVTTLILAAVLWSGRAVFKRDKIL